MRNRIFVILTVAVVAIALVVAALFATRGKEDDSTSSAASSAAAEEKPTVKESEKGMPTIEEKDGVPSLVFEKGSKAPSTLQFYVAEKGGDIEVGENDFVVADYIGYVWGSEKEFDSSFSRNAPLEMNLNNLVKGWKYTLAGTHVGDKVVISIPSKYGYGETGQPSAGIGGDDTIVFYVNIRAAFNSSSAGQADAQEMVNVDSLPVTIDAKLGEPVKTIALRDPKATAPSETTVEVIGEGSGDEVQDGDSVLVAYAAIPYASDQMDSTWANGNGPVPVVASSSDTASPFGALIGQRVGSRVIIHMAASAETGSPGFEVVLDILQRSAAAQTGEASAEGE